MVDECKSCTFEVWDGDKFCRQCGDELDLLNCECGAEVENADNFCHQCGISFDGVIDEAGPESQFPQPGPLQPQQPFNPGFNNQ